MPDSESLPGSGDRQPAPASLLRRVANFAQMAAVGEHPVEAADFLGQPLPVTVDPQVKLRAADREERRVEDFGLVAQPPSAGSHDLPSARHFRSLTGSPPLAGEPL